MLPQRRIAPAILSGGQASQWGRTEEAQRQLAEQLGAMRGPYGFISSKARPTSSARVAPVDPIGLTTEAKSGNLSDKDCRLIWAVASGLP